jgi:hypothetical protein
MTTASHDESATSIAKDDVQTVDDNGVTVAWRATITVEQAEDLHKAPNDEPAGIRAIPGNLVIEFHYADVGNVGVYLLEPSDSLYHAARSMWSQFSPRLTSLPTYIMIRPAIDTD